MAKLHFYYSAMNAGKSTTLLQSSYNYNERGMDTLLYTPMVDKRFGHGKITSRIGLQSNAVAITRDCDLFSFTQQSLQDNPNIHCILIDEAQFLSKQQIQQLARICDFLDLPVLAYGIRSDFRGDPFEGSAYLLATADNIIEIKTICHCGKKATMNMRLDEKGRVVTEGAQVDIGGNEKYIAVCRKHFQLKEVQSDMMEARNCVNGFIS
jgi:thymidine kinase